ncbi:MAG: hypothetical protein HOC71_13940 [Candidatus Latescibacteria bacterium]|nr:hypothetical protein [Candidatus Latescibacterota bacterium]
MKLYSAIYYFCVENIEVTEIVQRAGFRPFVHSPAKRHRLGGYVLNTPDGIIIEVEGKPEAADIIHIIW